MNVESIENIAEFPPFNTAAELHRAAQPRATLVLLPAIGLVVQGSTTVSYGSVADFVRPRYQARGYAIIYTVSSMAPVTSMAALGWIADTGGLDVLLWLLVALTALTLPVVGILPGRPQPNESATPRSA